MLYPNKLLIPCVDAYSSLILTDEKARTKAILQGFIRCFADGGSWIDYYNSYDYKEYGVFRGFKLSSDFIKSNFNDIHLVIENCLKNHYSILYNVDTYYIKNYVTFHQEHHIHPLFIYRIGENEEYYQCRDYFDFVHYSEQSVSRLDLNMAFEHNYCLNQLYYDSVLIGFQLDAKNRNSFDGIKKEDTINKLIRLLKEFLGGFNFHQYDIEYNIDEKIKIRKGSQIFDGMKIKIEKNIDGINTTIFDKKNKLLEHHIYMMKERIKILQNIYSIDQDAKLYQSICNVLEQSEILTMTVLKYNITHNDSLLFEIVRMLDHIKLQYLLNIAELINQLLHLSIEL